MRSPRTRIVNLGFLLAFAFLPACSFGQADIVKTEGITGPLHQANVGKVIFTPKSIPVETLKETDFLKTLELTDTSDLAFIAFQGNSLTNYLHRVAPQLSVEELTRSGNYQFSFFVDGALIHQENFSPAWVRAENKNTKTIYSAVLLNSANPDSRWGVLWHIFLLSGGARALTSGRHMLRLEMRPYLTTPQLKIGELIASGELQIDVKKSLVDEKLRPVQTIQPGSGWQISTDAYDAQKIRELNRDIAAGLYKEIKSLVVLKNGRLLIEEYFNGADRTTLQNTRSVGKSFTSSVMGIAIHEGHIKSEQQTLKDFYDLKTFASYSPKKETVTLKSLLTMSSGFDANDDDQNSAGNENNMYPTDNWVKFALDLPMDDKTAVGEKWRYFTAGLITLGDIINRSVPGGMEKYADQKLFQPLGITKYQWQYTPQKVVNTAGGLEMTALDFAKFGQLYQNGGNWNGKQIIPTDWVRKTFTRYINVPYAPNLFYGYLFWNVTYKVGNKQYETFFATGNGGNKIFVFKDQPLVVVITATAFGKWYMHRQADSMMERYILPAVIH
jgi:CubicO group peptidase (beta-lactamase class C family)